MRIPALASCLLFLLTGTGLAQVPIEFKASADGKTITEEDFLTVRFTLYNAKGGDFQPPPFDDFLVQSGPNTAIRQSSINGRMQSEFTFSFVLLPRRTGKLTIGPASIRADNQTFKTRPLSIEVIAADLREEGREMLLRVEPSERRIWLGQQFNLDYVLYSREPWRDLNIVEEPEYPDMDVHEMQRFNMRAVRDVIDGRPYTRQVIRRKALFPQRSGRFAIDTLLVQVGTSESEGDTRPSLFNIAPLKYRLLRSDTVEVNVLPLPPGPPPGFSGAVGRYRIELESNTRQLTTDDAAELRLTFFGDGDPKRIQAPPLPLPEGIRLYEQRLVEERSLELNGKLMGRKTFSYLLLPERAGTFYLIPDLVYFDPDSADYVRLPADSLKLEVRPGRQQPGEAIGEREAMREQLRPIRLDTRLEQRRNNPFVGSAWFWLITALPFLLLGGLAGRARWRARRQDRTPDFGKGKARQLALRQLEGLDMESPHALKDLQQLLLTYLRRRLRLPDGRTEALLRAAGSAGWPENSRKEIAEILQELERGQFAGAAAGVKPRAMQSRIRQWLEQSKP